MCWWTDSRCYRGGRIPKAVRSVFRGSVQPKQVASADIIQVCLDVSEHPSRGAAQAEVIWARTDGGQAKLIVLASAVVANAVTVTERAGSTQRCSPARVFQA